ncbi:MAG: CoA transferase [Chloroflexota bacterium]
MNNSASTKQGPLHGYKILDLTAVVVGPYATQIMGDLGAEIIRLESPIGDIVRRTGFSPPNDPNSEFGTLYMTLNRNKRSIVLDLKKPESAPALRALIEWADVLIHNIRPQAIERLGYGYEQVKAINPQIIYTHIVGFGSDGPYSGIAAYDDTVQAISGAASLITYMDGDPQPRNVNTLIADKTTALHALYAVLAALLHRERTGEGQHVEVPMFESVVSYLLPEHLAGAVWEPSRGPMSYPRTSHAHNRPFKTQDGYLAIMPYVDKHWRDLLGAGEADLSHLMDNDPRFETIAKRRLHMAELSVILETIMVTRTTKQWAAFFIDHDIPFMNVHTLESLMEDEHLAAVNFFEHHVHPPTDETYIAMRHPVIFSETPTSIRSHPPGLGQDGRVILADMGMDTDVIEQLVAAGVLLGSE